MVAGLAHQRDGVAVGVRGRGDGELGVGGMQSGEELERRGRARRVAERGGGCGLGGREAAECREVVRPE